MKSFAATSSLFVLLLVPALAANLSGKWSGTIAVKDESSGAVITTPVEIQLDQHESSISGKIGRANDRDAVPLRNVRVEGNKIYFEAVSEETTGPCKFVLTLAGNSMEGDMTGAIDSEDITGKVKVTRLPE